MPGNWDEWDNRKWDVDGNPKVGNMPSEFVQTRAFKPHRCKISDKVIYPCEQAWCKTYYHYYNGEVAFEEWICKEEMLFAKLRGERL